MRWHGRRGEGVVDHLLALTLGFLVVVVLAYINIADVRRALGMVLDEGLDAVGFQIKND